MCYRDVKEVLKGCYMVVTEVLQCCYKGFTGVLQGYYRDVTKGYCIGVTWAFHESYRDITGEL